MNALAKVLIFKISATVFVWCVPLLLFPASVINAIGFPEQETYQWVRMLGWAYLALCVDYSFALKAALAGKRAMAPIYAGIVSNGGACLYLVYYGATGTWDGWAISMHVIGWGSAVATALITAGLVIFGVYGEGEKV
jgi:hypothetical protein